MQIIYKSTRYCELLTLHMLEERIIVESNIQGMNRQEGLRVV